jgi:ABC-type phosphonate transport system ATPase subunit
VAELAERGLVEDRPSLTAGEVRAAVGTSAAGLGTAMADATRRYERVRYGMRPPTDEDVAALAEAERRARSAWAG